MVFSVAEILAGLVALRGFRDEVPGRDRKRTYLPLSTGK
jgi:hypothetical protein